MNGVYASCRGKSRRPRLGLVAAVLAPLLAGQAALAQTVELEDNPNRTRFNKKAVQDDPSISFSFSVTPDAAGEYNVALEQNIEAEEPIVSRRNRTTGTTAVRFNLSDLYDSTPEDGTKVTVYVNVKQFGFGSTFGTTTTDTSSSSSLSLSFYFDYSAPDAPAIKKVLPGENSLTVSWSRPAGEGNEKLKYKVLVRSKGREFDGPEEEGITASSYRIRDLINDETYEIAVTATDEAGNESERSAIKDGTPQSVDDYYEQYEHAGGGDEGGFCFVATAAYGSYDAGAVKVLRQWRDAVLLPTRWGRAFVHWYYARGPAWAAAIAPSWARRTAVRAALEPVTALAAMHLLLKGVPVAPPATPATAGFLLAMLVVLVWARPGRRRS